MTMRFPYIPRKSPKPIMSLGGRLFRPRPLVHVTVLGPRKNHVDLALLDTGADDTVFPETIAAKLGIDLTDAPLGHMGGVGGGAGQLRYTQVTLRLTDGREFREWTAWIGFTTSRLKQPLLGFAGCLQFFHANFLGDREEVELTVNSFYAGS